MSDTIVIAYYDFDWDEVSSRFSEEEFFSLKEEDYEYWHVLTCQDYNVNPIWDYEDLASEIMPDKAERFQDDIDYVDIGDVIDLITDRTGWLVQEIQLKSDKTESNEK